MQDANRLLQQGSDIMDASIVNAPVALDLTTLLVIATCITALLGLFLLSTWAQERIRALAWWGAAYLLGGFSVAIWSIENLISPPLPAGAANALLFLGAARIFHGRSVPWLSMTAGAAAWLAASMVTGFEQSLLARIAISSVIVATYTFLTAVELWRERRKTVLRRWPAIFIPLLHGAVFLLPIPLAGLLPAERGLVTLAGGWIALFVLEAMLYVVGTAFIVLVLAKERALRVQRDAALTDELTGVLNRRGFFSAAQELIARHARQRQPVSLVVFDLDQFKTINDRFGHRVGDEALRLFTRTAVDTLRASDIFARFGGEEFVAILPGSLPDACAAAERVRSAFEAAGQTIAGCTCGATVSAGATSAALCADIAALLVTADNALYRAKTNGRNRVERIEQEMPGDLKPSSGPGYAPEDAVLWHVPARRAAAA
jgi:diguanylate cyclase (GGDEF)-like protein